LFVAAFASLALAACTEDDLAGPPRVTEEDAAVLAVLRDLGVQGTVAVTDFVTVDKTGTHRGGRSFLLPRAKLEPLHRALDADPSAAPRLSRALAAAEVDDPELLDPANNTPIGDLAGRISPSLLRPTDPLQSQIQFQNRFISLDDEGKSFVVQTGDVLQTFLVPRQRAGGHYHGGSGIDKEERLPLRVGVMEPAAGSFSSAIWPTVWKAPEFAQEVFFDFEVRETSGPNAGDVNVFSTFRPYATRQSGFVRLPPNDALYVRTGGTVSHPEDFNDWGEGDIIARLQAFAQEYKAATGDRVSINDIALMFGGRFDVGKPNSASLVPCDDAHPELCWGYSHVEHRGSEADIRPVDRNDLERRRRFVDLADYAFVSFNNEGSHLHVRDRFSPFGM